MFDSLTDIIVRNAAKVTLDKLKGEDVTLNVTGVSTLTVRNIEVEGLYVWGVGVATVGLEGVAERLMVEVRDVSGGC